LAGGQDFIDLGRNRFFSFDGSLVAGFSGNQLGANLVADFLGALGCDSHLSSPCGLDSGFARADVKSSDIWFAVDRDAFCFDF